MKRDRLNQTVDALKALGKGRVLVGIPADNAFRDPDVGEVTVEANNAQIGYVHEFGSPARNIPARPFLIPGIENARRAIGDRFVINIRKTLAGNFTTMDTAFHEVGLIAQALVRKKITDGPFAPLSEVTLAKRRAKGRTGTKPLIDTTQLRNSINYVIRA